MNSQQLEIVSWSAAELAARIRARDVSPSEAVEAALARIEDCNPRINAICTVAADQAMAAARAAERLLRREDEPLPPLLGVPVGIKDITPTAGIRTTYGSPLCRDHVPTEDAEVVARLKAAGAIVIGKTNTPEFAAGANTVNPVFGATRNPWNPALCAGGSTGGGAAALATGMIALAQGTDLGGSLRNPAAFCGVVGLRPTPGVVPSTPNPAPWDTLQVDGPMARSAEDCWLALRAMAGLSRRAPVTAAPQDLDADLTPALPRRIVYVADIAGYGIDPEIAEQCRAAAFALSDAGCEVEEIELDLSAGREVFLTLRGAVIVSQLYPYLDRLDELGENLRGNVRYGLGVGSAELAAAQHRRQALWHQVMSVLDRYPLLLTPCTPVLPFPVERNYPDRIAGRAMRNYIDWVAPTFLLSLLGMPVASVPAGLSRAGLPIGLQVLGAPFAERQVLSAAAAVQARRPIGLPPAFGHGDAA